MKFVDEAFITVESGKGGDGCLSFRREKYIPRGGPNGGDGGKGGSIYLKGNKNLNNLLSFRNKKYYKAQDGCSGMSNGKTGKSGKNLVIYVPIGTMVFNGTTNNLIGDIKTVSDLLLIAKGGKNGIGNIHFKTSTNQYPIQRTLGCLGKKYYLRLELRVLADIGLLGLPNSGKSTLINSVSNTKSKIADYPFTTLYPILGVFFVSSNKKFIIADIPGLVKESSSGYGLGFNFLKHLSRTRILFHMVDISLYNDYGEDKVIESINIIDNEIKKYNIDLYSKLRWLIFNKIDLFLDKNNVKHTVNNIINKIQWRDKFFLISASTGEGIKKIVDALKKL
ncbi:GTPase ObgE [Candidatus Legionella polyplacis]|uniref:GTPase Obg n=1 Tax=Candidatus Legionella polyplacis TaxID=2005262 RepID=A0ABZ2H1E6_9GAMM